MSNPSNKSRLALLTEALVQECRLTAAEATALVACAEVGFEGAPADIAGDMSALMAAPVVTNPPLALYSTEFPDFELPFPIPEGWHDQSWHNDVCPSFVLGGGPEGLVGAERFQMFVDYADPAERELTGSARFRCIFMVPGEIVADTYVLETEDARSAQIFMLLVSLREDVRDWQDALSGEREGLDELCERVDALTRQAAL